MLYTVPLLLQPDGSFDLSAFKIVYVAPMKALVQEVVGNFTARLEPYNIKVSELTGDRQLTKAQIAETQVVLELSCVRPVAPVTLIRGRLLLTRFSRADHRHHA